MDELTKRRVRRIMVQYPELPPKAIIAAVRGRQRRTLPAYFERMIEMALDDGEETQKAR